MNERKMILSILKRLGYEIYSKEKNYIEFECDGYESICIDFDENGKVISIYC